MNIYYALIILICLSAAFAYLNQRFLKLPFVIGLFLLSTLLSLVVLATRFWMAHPNEEIRDIIENIHIEKIISDILLGFLLFAGASHTRWSDIKAQIRPVSLFALGGVLLSTAIIACLLYLTAYLLRLQLGIDACLLFGALISPTDPIAVLGILKQAGVPKQTESIIVGESLFNDGVGVVLFTALLGVASTGNFSLSGFSLLFLQEAAGGIAAGFILGYALYLLQKSIDHYQTEVLLTLAFVMAGFTFCNHYLHVSGALAMVVMGLMVGNFKRDVAMSESTQSYVYKFWELLDVILNAVLFIIIAFVIILIDFKLPYVIIGCTAVLIVLLSRVIIVYAPHLLLPRLLKLTNKEANLIIWGGLRGGLSLALALSLPESTTKDVLLIATYCCVLFSILVQGLSVGKLAKRKGTVPVSK